MTQPHGCDRRFRDLAIGLSAVVLLAACGSCLKEDPPIDESLWMTLHAPPASQPDSLTVPMPMHMPVGTSQPEGLTQVVPPPAGPLRLTVLSAVVIALQNNQALAVDRINPDIQRTLETQQLAVFDPILAGQTAYSRTANGLDAVNVGAAQNTIPVNGITSNVGLSKQTVEGGTVGVNLANTNALPDSGSTNTSSRLSLAVTQSLLRGAGVDVNMVSIRQARIATLSSMYELRGFAEQLVSDVQTTYWNYVLAQRQIDIVTNALNVAKKQLDQTDALIDVGKLAKTERAAAVAQVSVFQGNLIDAKATLVQTRLALLRLINPQGSNLWVRNIVPLNPPIAPDVTLDDVEQHVKVGLKMRPDLNQARLAVQNGDLQLVKTRNGLLPQLDLFMTLGKSGYSESFSGTFKEMASRGSYDVLGGVSFSYPPGNRGPEAVNRQAMLTRDQSAQALENMAQLVQVDVRSAYEELLRTREQVAATAATRVAQQVAWETEKAKLDQGKSTSLLVAQAQQNLLTAQINEIQAVTNYLNAFVSLFRLEGSLLERMGVKAPVPEPVSSNEGKAQ